MTKTLMNLKLIWVSLIYPWKSQLATQLAREVSYHVCTLVSHGADLLDFPALSKLLASQTDFVPPVPVQLSEAVARRLVSVKVYTDYTDSERKFVQLATDSGHACNENSRKLTGDSTKIWMLTFPFIGRDHAYHQVWSIEFILHSST